MCLNNMLKIILSKEFVIEPYIPLNSDKYAIFQKNGEGFYYICFKSRDTTNIVSNAISYFTGGKRISHCYLMYYHENLLEQLTPSQKIVLSTKWKIFYGAKSDIMSIKPKVVVLGSADKNGMNYFDYSYSQNRLQSIRKIPSELISKEKEKELLSFLFSSKVSEASYDYIGLVFWFLSRKLQDNNSWYCSELIYEACKKIGVRIAREDKPSPALIEDFNEDWIVFKNFK